MIAAYEHRGFVVSSQGYAGTVYLWRVGKPSTFVAVDLDGRSRFYLRAEPVGSEAPPSRPEAIERACDWLEEEVNPDV